MNGIDKNSESIILIKQTIDSEKVGHRYFVGYAISGIIDQYQFVSLQVCAGNFQWAFIRLNIVWHFLYEMYEALRDNYENYSDDRQIKSGLACNNDKPALCSDRPYCSLPQESREK